MSATSNLNKMLRLSLLLLSSSGFLLAQTYSVTSNEAAVTRYNDTVFGRHGMSSGGIHINGDTYLGFQGSNDGNQYLTICDTSVGFGSGNMMVLKTSPDLLTFTRVNALSGLGSFNTAIYSTNIAPAPCNPASNCSWKSTGIFSVGGNLYLAAGWSARSFPYVPGAYTFIMSPDHGAHWCNKTHIPCTSANWSATGDVPQPADMMWNISPDQLSWVQIIPYGTDGGTVPNVDNNSVYTYITITDAQLTPAKRLLGRVHTADLPLLDITKYQYYTNALNDGNGLEDGNWSSDPAAGVSIAALSNVEYLPGPGIYISIQSNIVDWSVNSVIETYAYTARYPWGPWVQSGYWPGQYDVAYQPLPVVSTETKISANQWKYKAVESGYYLFGRSSVADSDNYSPYIRDIIVTANPSATSGNPAYGGKLGKVMQDRSLHWLYDGTYTAGISLGAYDKSGAGNHATGVGFGAAYDTRGMAAFDGSTTLLKNSVQQTIGDATYFLVYRQCCKAPASAETPLNDLSATNTNLGVSYVRNSTTADSWKAVMWGATSSAFTEVDGSYHLIILRQTGTTATVYDSNSLSKNGTLTPITTFTTSTPSAGALATALGAEAKASNFMRGSIALAAEYSRSLANWEIADRILGINRYLASRGVFVPMSYTGAYPLDGQPLPYVGYSVRRLLGSYAGPLINVVRSSDSTAMDIYPNANGNIDITGTGPLMTFCASTTCTVARFYDQLGKHIDLIQSTAASRPSVVTSGTVNSANGKLMVTFSGANVMSTGTASFNIQTDAASFMGVNSLASNSVAWAVQAFMGVPTENTGPTTMQSMEFEAYNANYYFDAFRYTASPAPTVFPTAARGSLFASSQIFDGYYNRQHYDSNTQANFAMPVVNGGTFSGTIYYLGGDQRSSVYTTGNIPEALVYDYAITDQTYETYRTGTVAYFGTGVAASGALLLDSACPGGICPQAGAWSVARKLRSAYAGNALTIRRSSDNTTTNIGFDGSNNVDQAAITTFCSGSTCGIDTIYDQAGSNANLVSVTTTVANECIVYQSGAVVTQGGRLACSLAGLNPSGYVATGLGSVLNTLSAEMMAVTTLNSTSPGYAPIIVLGDGTHSGGGSTQALDMASRNNLANSMIVLHDSSGGPPITAITPGTLSWINTQYNDPGNANKTTLKIGTASTTTAAAMLGSTTALASTEVGMGVDLSGTATWQGYFSEAYVWNIISGQSATFHANVQTYYGVP